MHNKIIVLDFDGVVHSYTTPWMGHDWIPDPPVPGALAFIKKLLEAPGYDVQIFSSRSSHDSGIRQMQLYLKHWFIKEYGWDIGAGIGNELAKCSNLLEPNHSFYYIHFPRTKPPAWLTIDDRSYMFAGEFPTLDFIDKFKPWNKS